MRSGTISIIAVLLYHLFLSSHDWLYSFHTFQINHFSEKLNSIELCLVWSHTDNHCYEDKVSIELFYPNNSIRCRTKIIDNHEKDNLEWNGDKLESCENEEFNMDMEELKFNISAEKGHKDCKDPFSDHER